MFLPRVILAILLIPGFLTGGLLTGGIAAADTAPFDITGAVTVTRVVDGDSLKSGNLSIRLFGIDAPEGRQNCIYADGSEWTCGKAAASAMADIVAQAEQLQCTLIDVDRYGRLVMRCLAGDTDIAEALVKRGLAVAYRRYSKDYIGAEASAERGARGMWQGRFDMPWDWRRKN
ncbi:MAG: thermonuclease family protein [Alphaproteobacteria bacterium]|nr:thermonuclease family protein [Alphaproteobacteria bacterium]